MDWWIVTRKSPGTNGYSAFVVDHSGIGRELIVAGVDTDTRTVTSKFVLGVYTLTNYIICRDSEAVLKSLK